MSTPLNTMKNVNKHCLKALERAGVDTVEKLCAMTMHDLGKVKGIGGVGVVEIMRALSELGILGGTGCAHDRQTPVRTV